MEAPPAAELQAKRLSELKTARIVVFVDAASLPQHADHRLVLPQQLRPRNSDSGAGAVIMVVVGRVSGQQLCQLLSLVELQDVDKLQRSGVLMLYPPPMPPTAAATSEPAPHHTFPCGGTGFEPVPSEHRGSTSSSATLLPFIAGRVHEVVSPAARVVVVSGDVAMDCVVAQLQTFGRAAYRVAPTATVAAVAPEHGTGDHRPCVSRGATHVADSVAAAAPPAAEHPPLCVSCGTRMAEADGSTHTTSDRDSRSSGSRGSSVGSSSGGVDATARHAVGGGLDSASEAEAGASTSPRDCLDDFRSQEHGEATPPVPHVVGRVDADDAGGRPGATPSRNSAHVRKSELDLTAHCHHSDAAAFTGTLLMLVDEATMCVVIDGIPYALPDASVPVSFGSTSASASALCVATRDGAAVATPPAQLLSSLVRRLLRASSDPGAFVWLCMAELARQRALAIQNVAACDYLLLAEPATCGSGATSRGAARALTSGSPTPAVAPQASMDTVHAAVSKALLVGLRAHAAKLRPEHEVLVLELWAQHCMWICHCACGSKLLPSLVERLKRVQGQADCGGSDELADNVVDLCMHSTQCRGFPCGGDVLALFAWLGTRLQEGEVPLPHAG